MSVTLESAAPPGQSDEMPASAEPTLEECVHALGVTVDRLAADLADERAEKATVSRDRDRLLDLNVTLDARYLDALAERDGEIRDLLNAGRAKDATILEQSAAIVRHERAAEAHAAIEAATPLKPNTRALLLATLSGSLLTPGLAATVAGFAMNLMPIAVAGFAVTGIALALLLLVCQSPHPDRPFDLDDEAVDRG